MDSEDQFSEVKQFIKDNGVEWQESNFSDLDPVRMSFLFSHIRRLELQEEMKKQAVKEKEIKKKRDLKNFK